ncbi:MAG TPA: TIGR03435 family protein [Terriglobia bacterium]|jgi:uncharacterized protein (TIGR03435 family)
MKRDEEKVAKMLKEALPSDERMELARARVLEGLRSASASGQVPNNDVSKYTPNRLYWGIAIAALVLLSIPLARRSVTNRNVYAMVENEDGPRYRVAAGQIVATDVWTRLTVTLPDGSRMEMRPQSQLSVNGAADGLRVQLDRGGIIVNAATQRAGHLYVDTKDVTVSVVGTVFLVAAEEPGSRVGVLEGKVQVKQGGLTKMLLPPEQMVTNPLMELPSLREQIAWSRYAKEHLALLQLYAAPVVAKQVEKPVEIAQAQEPPKPAQSNPPTPASVRPQFEVASVKRNNSGSRSGGLRGGIGRYSVTNLPLSVLIQVAYNVRDFQIVGAPAWVNLERYDIAATGEGNLDNNQISGPMVQALIAERFKLVMHGETRDLPVYFLTIAKSGSKLKASQCLPREPNTPAPPNQPRSTFCGSITISGASLEASTQMQKLADALSGVLQRKVLDRTGLTGDFDMKLRWTPDLSTPVNADAAPPDGGPSIFTAIEEQLGLKLESGKAPIDVLVIDHIDHASDN